MAEAAPRVEEFLRGELAEDGGARDREGKSDLYYTAFLLDALVALRAELPTSQVRAYLRGFGHGAELDLVHRACLVRCWAALEEWPSDAFRADLLSGVEACRSADGGYGKQPGREVGTLYDAFLALGVYQDLEQPLPRRDELIASFAPLRTDDGAYANVRDFAMGTTPSTAAAAALLQQLGAPVSPDVGDWLLAQQHIKGGFKAMPDAPLPDLLSTATSLHALASLGRDVGPGREAALDFLDSLWTGRSFCGHWADDELDSEYTFYALLALGHLSVEA